MLSGGERGRLMLARALAQPSNLLVLDEPTNDLDLETLDLLEEMLADYAGTVILVSHDRDFLDRIVNAVIVPEGDGRWIEYAGGYSDMVAQRGADLAGTKQAPGSKAGLKPSRGADAGQPRARRQGTAPSARLSFKEEKKHALESLPRRRLLPCKPSCANCQERLADPQLFTPRDRPASAQASEAARCQGRPAKLAAAEERWLELELLREEIEGA